MSAFGPDLHTSSSATHHTDAAILETQSNSGSGSLTCVAVLSPPPCQIHDPNSASTPCPTNARTGANGHDDNITTITYSNHQPAWDCCFSLDGRHLAVGYGAPDPCVRIFKHDTSWHLHATLVGVQTRTIRCVAFAPIHRPLVLAAASFDGTIAIWESSVVGATVAPSSSSQQIGSTSTSTETQPNHFDHSWECTAQLEGHDNEVKGVVWNATGSLLTTCGRDKTLWIWECFLPGAVGGTNSSTTSTTAVTPTHGLDTGGADWECLAVLSGHTADVKCVQFAASHGLWGDGDEIVVSASYDVTIRIWAEDAGDWYQAACLSDVHTATIWTLTVAPSGTRLLSGSADGSLAIYQCFSGAELQAASQSNENDTSVKDGRIRGGLKAEWKCVGTLPNAHDGIVYSVDYASARASHGRIASGGSDNCLRIYREALLLQSSTSTVPTEPRPPQFHVDAIARHVSGGDINCVRWHPSDGSILASASDDGGVRIWNYRHVS